MLRAPAVLQAKFLGIWVNDETKKGFTVDDDETGEINAVEVKGAQSGIAKYSFFKDALILEHIKSNPEEGSGIGSLLMHLVALRAQTAGKTRIIVSKPANTAAGYYAKMGFDLEGARQKRRQMFIDAGREADIPAEITVTEIEAGTNTVLATAGQSAGKRWTLGSKPISIPKSKVPRQRPVNQVEEPSPSASRVRSSYLGKLGIHKAPPPQESEEELQFDLEL